MNWVYWGLTGAFLVERLFLQGLLGNLGPNATDYFEGFLVLSFIVLSHEKIRWKFKVDWKWAFIASLNFVAGAGIFFLGEGMGLVVPFDFNGLGFALLLLVIGPFIEEFLYRGLLWDVSRPVIRSVFWTVILTSILFSLDHFLAYFKVPDIFRGYVLYQTIYTLAFGLFWGYMRHKKNSVLPAILLHALFNLGFFCAAKVYPRLPVAEQKPVAEAKSSDNQTALPPEASEWHEFTEAVQGIKAEIEKRGAEDKETRPKDSPPRILIADMPVSNLEYFQRDKNVHIYTPANVSAENQLGEGCAEDLTHIEEWFAALAANRAPPFALDAKMVSRLENTLWAAHGYHELGLVQQGLKHSEILLQPVSHPPSISVGVSDYHKYLVNTALPELVGLYEKIHKFHPDMVLVSSFYSFEETERDLRNGGYKAEEAKVGATEIMKRLIGAWSTLINASPKVLFVVPSGDGGEDNIGDRLDSHMVLKGPIPAVLPFPNMLRVASYEKRSGSCLSSFSNFGVEASDVAARGREIQSWAPCPSRPFVKLSGTATAAAKIVSYLAQSLESGISTEEALKHLQKEKCLEDRVSTAARLPEP